MMALIASEFIKGKRTFVAKSLIIFPLCVCMLSALLMAGESTQMGAANWWYAMFLPVVLALVGIHMIEIEQATQGFNLAVLPIERQRIWQAKVWVGCLYIFVANGMFLAFTVGIGFVLPANYPFLKLVVAALILSLTTVWQIPLVMYLRLHLSSILTFIIVLGLNIICGIQDIAGGDLWVIPFAIPVRLMSPILELNPNGIGLTAESPLNDSGVILPGIIVNGLLFVLLMWFTTRESKKRGAHYAQLC